MNSAHNPRRLTWNRLYREAELYKAAVRLYTKPLLNWRRALSSSTDGNTLYDFARHGLKNLDAIHRALIRREYRFRPGLRLKRNFNGKRRSLYVYPWEERLVSLLLYRLLNRALDRRFSTSSYAYRRRGFGIDRCQREIVRSLKSMGGGAYVMKRDVSDFFASIDHGILLDKLEQFVEPDDYLFDLLTDCVRFTYHDDDDVTTARRGVPFGTAIACLFANVYLMELDKRLESLPGIRFLRYADDLLVLSGDKDDIHRARRAFECEMRSLKLQSKLRHECDFLLTNAANTEGPSSTVDRFRHLGLEFRADGSVGLSRDKSRKIRNLFRFAFRRHKARFEKMRSPESRAELAVTIARRTLEKGVRNVAIIDYYLKHVTDEDQLKRLDRWLAEEVLSLAFAGGHKKRYFRSLPFKRLRQIGLPSLVHRRRLIRHGHVETPFFIWSTYRANQRCGGTAARPKPTEVSAFSQGPEAVACKPS